MEWPQPPAAPRWMAWAPQAAVLWALAYGVVRVFWAVHGAPSSGPQHTDLIFFTGGRAVALCAAAAVVALALRTAPWHRLLLVAAWGVSAALAVACPLLLLDVVGLLLPGSGVPSRPLPFLSRVACFAEAVLVAAAAEAYRRRWRSACLFCGRTGIRVRPATLPRWAWWAAYVALAGCLVRLGAQVAVGFGGLQKAGASAYAFEAGFILAGIVLPLALVHSWGRVLPRWAPVLAGRQVPRWLLLGPAFAIAAGLTVYFGVTLVYVAVQTFSGDWKPVAGLPLAFFWVAVPGYWVWGLGLGAAALAYYQLTRPACRVCGGESPPHQREHAPA